MVKMSNLLSESLTIQQTVAYIICLQLKWQLVFLEHLTVCFPSSWISKILSYFAYIYCISIFRLILLSKTVRPQQESVELYRTTPLIQLYHDTTFRQALMFLLVPVERGWRRNEQHRDQGGDKCMICYRTSFFPREDVDISKSRVGTKWMAARWLL